MRGRGTPRSETTMRMIARSRIATDSFGVVAAEGGTLCERSGDFRGGRRERAGRACAGEAFRVMRTFRSDNVACKKVNRTRRRVRGRGHCGGGRRKGGTRCVHCPMRRSVECNPLTSEMLPPQHLWNFVITRPKFAFLWPCDRPPPDPCDGLYGVTLPHTGSQSFDIETMRSPCSAILCAASL